MEYCQQKKLVSSLYLAGIHILLQEKKNEYIFRIDILDTYFEIILWFSILYPFFLPRKRVRSLLPRQLLPPPVRNELENWRKISHPTCNIDVCAQAKSDYLLMNFSYPPCYGPRWKKKASFTYIHNTYRPTYMKKKWSTVWSIMMDFKTNHTYNLYYVLNHIFENAALSYILKLKWRHLSIQIQKRAWSLRSCRSIPI